MGSGLPSPAMGSPCLGFHSCCPSCASSKVVLGGFKRAFVPRGWQDVQGRLWDKIHGPALWDVFLGSQNPSHPNPSCIP